MQERQQLAEDGVITVAAMLDWHGELVSKPAINFSGVVTNIEQSLLKELITRNIAKTTRDRWSEFVQIIDGEIDVQWESLKEALELSLRRLIKRETQTVPLIVVLLQYPEKPQKDTKVYRRKRPTASVAS
jgi:ribonuclease J